MEAPSKHDVLELTESLKKRLRANTSGSRSAKAATLTALSRDLLDALDLLVAQNETLRALEDSNPTDSPRTSAPPAEPPATANISTETLFAELSARLGDTLDESLSQWQVQIAASCSQAISRDLKEQISAVRNLSNEFRESQSNLDAKREALDAQMTEALRLKSRYSRQRKVLAKEIRTQRAELHLAMESRYAAIRAEIEATMRSELEQALASEHATQISSLETAVSERDALLEQLERKLNDAIVESNLFQDECSQLRTEAANRPEANEDVEKLEKELSECKELLAVFEGEQPAQSGASSEQVAELEAELSSVQAQLKNAQAQIEDIQNAQADPAFDISAFQLERLQEELSQRQLELQDLRSQNSDLAAQIAKRQVISSGNSPHVSFNQESLTWEERKRLILQQLENEQEGDASPEVHSKQVAIDDVISATQLEIERRDREIAELHNIIEQQSNTREGVAIGAAAIAQMIDSDELVNQERQKLKDIQQQWEEKLRKAEIDLSLERAKLAREKTRLETELAMLAPNMPNQSVPAQIAAQDGETKAQTRTRKWLQHLGLKDSD